MTKKPQGRQAWSRKKPWGRGRPCRPTHGALKGLAALLLVSALSACGRAEESALPGLPPEAPFQRPSDLSRLERFLRMGGTDFSTSRDVAAFVFDGAENDGLFFMAEGGAPLRGGFQGLSALIRQNTLPSPASLVSPDEGFSEADVTETAPGEGTFAGTMGLEGGHGLGWRNRGDSSRADWRLYLDGIPVEGVQVRERLSGSVPDYAQGNVPRYVVRALHAAATDEHIPSADGPKAPRVGTFGITPEKAKELAAWALNFHPWRVSFPEKVWIPARGAFVPAYKAIVDSSADAPGRGPAWPLEVLVDGRTGDLLDQRVLAFHVDGKAMLYDENAVASEAEGLKETTLPSLDGDGTRLKHSLFSVLSCDMREATDACSPVALGLAGGDFRTIDYESRSIDEVVAYHAVTKSMAWYRKIMSTKPAAGTAWGPGYPGARTDFGIAQDLGLKIYVRALTKTGTGYTPDNAAYMPSALRAGSTARIIIGTGWEPGQADGDRRLLRYLGRDTDVVMHEFGHHTIYRTLRDVSGQGGALHEGLADYFTYAITGNNKLGESIVAVGESLRSGTKAGRIEQYVSAKPHKAGEFWSSVMWEVRQSLGPWKDGFHVFDKIAWEAVDLFKENAGYYDVISAFAKAAEAFALAEGRSANELKNEMFIVFHKRGFIQAPDGTGKLPAATSTIASSYEASLPASETESISVSEGSDRKAWYECGVVSGLGRGSTSWPLAALLLLPLALPLLASSRLRRSSLPCRTKPRSPLAWRRPRL